MKQKLLDQYHHLTQGIPLLEVWIHTFTSLSTFLCYNLDLDQYLHLTEYILIQ